jgi:hypothetical protein
MRTIDPLHQLSHWENRRRYRDPRHRMAEAFARPKVNWLAAHGWVYENRSPSASLPVARRLEARTATGAYWLVVAGAAGRSS